MKWNIVKPAVKNYENSKTISLDWCDNHNNTMGKVSFIFNILGMKTISQMAKECGCTYREVVDVVRNLNFTPDKYIQRNRFYCKSKEDLIYKTLYFIGKCNMVTFESKMNVKETFEEFKERTYTRL